MRRGITLRVDENRRPSNGAAPRLCVLRLALFLELRGSLWGSTIKSLIRVASSVVHYGPLRKDESDWSDYAKFVDVVLTAEPLDNVAHSIKRKIFSVLTTKCFDTGTYCPRQSLAHEMRAEDGL